MLRLLAFVLTALFIGPLPAGAVPITGPIVFDFEDGMQGWQLHGSAQRVRTQLLGGEWAIFGDAFSQGGARIILPASEFPHQGTISYDLLVVDGDGGISGFIGFESDVLTMDDAGGTSGLILFDTVNPLIVESRGLQWDSVVAFIDNITFHPMPEPSTMQLLPVVLMALVLIRRRSRAAR